MIKNERQYIITKGQIRKFKTALEQFDNEKTDTDPMLIKAQKEAMESQLAELEDQVKEYEQLRTGNYQMLETPSLQKLPLELIRARIAMGMTQKQLAERLGLKEQQIQRYEETEYASASFSRLMEIIKALELEVREEIFLPDRGKMRETHTTGV